MTPVESLKQIRKELDDRKARRARLEGQRDQLLATLRRDFELDSAAAASGRADELEAGLARMDAELTDGVAKLEDAMKGMAP